MKSIITGIALMIVVSVVAWALTNTQRTSSESAFSSPNNSVRLD